jgi:uncharacterized protein
LIVLDANVLLYAYDDTSTHHAVARRWLSETLSGPELVGLPWQSVWAFLRIGTDSRILSKCLTMETAMNLVQLWTDRKQVQMLAPGERHWKLLRQMLSDGGVRGSHTTDAALAALTIEHGGILHTTDRGFARYPGLRFLNPLTH